MKRSEIAMIIFIASLSMMLTFTLVNSLLGEKIKRTASVEETAEISGAIEVPAKRIFNKKAINPTVEVCVEANNGESDTVSATCNNPSSDEQSETEVAAPKPTDENNNN